MQYFPSLCSLCNVQYLEAWDELQWNGRRVQYLAKSVSLASLSEITKCMTDIGSFLALLFYCETALVANFQPWWWWLVLDRVTWEELPLKRKQPAANSEIERARDASGQCGGVVCILLGDADWQWRRSGDSGDGEGDGPTCPGQLCSVRPPGRSRAQPLYQHRTLVVPH